MRDQRETRREDGAEEFKTWHKTEGQVGGHEALRRHSKPQEKVVPQDKGTSGSWTGAVTWVRGYVGAERLMARHPLH